MASSATTADIPPAFANMTATLAATAKATLGANDTADFRGRASSFCMLSYTDGEEKELTIHNATMPNHESYASRHGYGVQLQLSLRPRPDPPFLPRTCATFSGV